MAAKHPHVYCNPYHVLDHEGHPCSVFPFAPEHGAGSRRFVGACIATVDMLEKPGAVDTKTKGELASFKLAGATQFIGRSPRQRTHWAFDLTPQPVLAIPHYRMGARDGSLFAADPYSARVLNVPFVDPLKALAAARAEAIALWTQEHGEPPPIEEWSENLGRVADAVVEAAATGPTPETTPAPVAGETKDGDA